MRLIFSRAVVTFNSILALPPPAATWHTEQLTCK